MITVHDLRERNIYADETSAALLGFTDLSPEEIDILLSYIDLPDGRTLTVRIGGIGYRAYLNDDGRMVEILVNVHDSCFSYPFTVLVKRCHEPRARDEHVDTCPFAWDEWPKDEQGDEYWVAPEDTVYDAATDTWTAPEHKRHYDVECLCPYVEDEERTFDVQDDVSLGLVRDDLTRQIVT